MNLTLPYPPGVNQAYRSIVLRGRPMVLLSKEARQFKAVAAQIALAAGSRPMEGPLSLSYALYRPRKSGDLDRCLKLLLDALEGVCYVNDSQIVELHGRRFDDKLNPRVEVTISASG